MKNLIKSVVAVVAIIFSITTQSQTKSPKLENSLLWEISGNGLSKPSYLYGTVHMICSGDYFLAEKTKKVFEASNKLVLEVNLSDPNEMKYAEQMVMGKKPLVETLTSEELTKLDKILRQNAKVTVKQVDAYSMMAVMSLISVRSFGCEDLKQYESIFMEMATKKNMGISGFETIKYQLESLDKAYSNSEMIAMLEYSNQGETTKFVTDYKNEDIDALYKSNTDEKVMNQKAKKYALDNRNINWSKKMPEMMQKESVFFAVGAAHLAGELGVINLLKKAGYTVKPIMN
jgi:uncharacterized protein YbaP (TraB family)